MRLGPVLQESLDQFNVTKQVPTQDAGIVKIKNELAEVSDLMRENIHKVLDRGERLDELGDNTDQLVAQTVMFQKQARKLKRKMCYDKWLWRCLAIALVCLVALVIYLLVKFK